MVLFLRILLFILLCYGIYWCIKYLLHPYRKISRAIEQKRTLMMDDKGNVHRNILLVYKGVLFEGEKYMGTTEQAFQIVKIHLWPRQPEGLVGLQKKDFEEIMSMIYTTYPHAEITWKSPIRELFNNNHNEKP